IGIRVHPCPSVAKFRILIWETFTPLVELLGRATDGHGYTRIGIGSDRGRNWFRLRGCKCAGRRIPGEGLGTSLAPGTCVAWRKRQGSDLISGLLPRAVRGRIRGRSGG